jgi:hypothetical protein
VRAVQRNKRTSIVLLGSRHRQIVGRNGENLKGVGVRNVLASDRRRADASAVVGVS